MSNTRKMSPVQYVVLYQRVNRMSNTRKMSPVQYETLHLASLAFGGIGSGFFADHCGAPLCVWGYWLRGYLGTGHVLPPPISAAENDDAVRAINRRKKAYYGQRVSFEEYAAELHLVPSARNRSL